jgi:hypothetical protein
LRIVKAALTSQQVPTLDLPKGLPSKETSSRHKKFVERHGDTVWELEALPTETLREIVEVSIRGQLDLEAFNREVEKERDEKAELAKVRERTINVLSGATGGARMKFDTSAPHDRRRHRAPGISDRLRRRFFDAMR